MSSIAPPSVAFLTVSYGPDRDRCALLTESLAAFAPTYDHWIVVDRADLPLFRSLESARTTVLTTEEVLPVWIRRLNLRRIGIRSNVWLTARGRPVRGWLVQQLVKLAAAEAVATDVVVHSDSDVVLVARPFRPGALVDDEGRVRLVAVPGAIDATLETPRRMAANRGTAARDPSRGAPDDGLRRRASCRGNARTPCASSATSRRGRARPGCGRSPARGTSRSRYLDGRFITDVLGDGSGQFTSAASLCHDYWTHARLGPAELDGFLDGIGPEEVAVSITAKAGMQPSEIRGALERRWAANA